MKTIEKLYLIRHGISEANIEGSVCGQKDSPLAKDGVKDLVRISQHPSLSKITDLHCHSSHLSRAYMTAKILGFKNVFQTTALAETNTGRLSDLLLNEVNARFPEFRHHETNLDARYPGGETTREMINRVSTFTDSVLEKNRTNTELVIVAHSGPINAIICHLMGITLDSFPSIRIEHGKITILTKPTLGARHWRLELLNAEQI